MRNRERKLKRMRRRSGPWLWHEERAAAPGERTDDDWWDYTGSIRSRLTWTTEKEPS